MSDQSRRRTLSRTAYSDASITLREIDGGRLLRCAMVKSRYIGDGHPTFNRNPYNGYIKPYYWIDDHPLLYGNNGSLDPGTDLLVQVATWRVIPGGT